MKLSLLDKLVNMIFSYLSLFSWLVLYRLRIAAKLVWKRNKGHFEAL